MKPLYVFLQTPPYFSLKLAMLALEIYQFLRIHILGVPPDHVIVEFGNFHSANLAGNLGGLEMHPILVIDLVVFILESLSAPATFEGFCGRVLELDVTEINGFVDENFTAMLALNRLKLFALLRVVYVSLFNVSHQQLPSRVRLSAFVGEACVEFASVSRLEVIDHFVSYRGKGAGGTGKFSASRLVFRGSGVFLL